MKAPVIYGPDPPRRASLCPGVKAVFPLVQNLNETPVPLRMYGMRRTQYDHARSDLLSRETYVNMALELHRFQPHSVTFGFLSLFLVVDIKHF